MASTSSKIWVVAAAVAAGVGWWTFGHGDGASPADPSDSGERADSVSMREETVPGDAAPPFDAVATSTRRAPADDDEVATDPRLCGVVVDDSTDRPVCGVVVSIGKDSELVESTTDADGGFEFDASVGRHTFGLRLESGAKVPFSKRRRNIEAIDLPVEIRARIGPRYLVEIVGPTAAQEADWNAHLVARVTRPGTATTEVDRVTAQPLLSGEPRSVRFPSLPKAKDGETLWLSLRDASGEWRGAVVAPTLVGEHPDVLQVVVSRSGVVRGRVAWSSGAPVDRASVHLTRADGLAWPPIEGPWDDERTDESGRFVFDGVPPGEHFLLVAAPSMPMVQRRLAVPEGTLDVGTIEVEGGGEPGIVAGVLQSAAGRDGLCAILQLESIDGTGWATSTIVGRPSALIALFYGGRPAQPATDVVEVAFRFENVPAGRYRLVVVPWDGRRYAPSSLELTAPTDDVLVVREDASAAVPFGFDVVDAETGEQIDEFMARFHTARWGKEKSFPHRSGEVLGEIAPDGDLSWAVFAEGFAPAWGDASAFTSGGAPPRIHRVELERGWGADFVVRDGRDPRRHHDRAMNKLSIPAPGELPLAGVRVVADGATLGTTGADGRVRVRLDARPSSLEFVLDGWIVTPTTTFDGTRVLHDSPSPKVWMVPKP